MNKAHLEAVAQAFSRKSQIYDFFGEGHENLIRMRRKVRQHVLRYLKPGDRILELNAGTGEDAIFFAGQGFPVHATDLSVGMVSRIQEKIKTLGMETVLSAQLCSVTDLSVVDGRFQYIFSNMGGMNCIDDPSLVARQFARLLVSGGYVTWVVMPPVCPWELSLALRGRFRTAVRRLKPGGVWAQVEQSRFMTWYYSPTRIVSAFGNGFGIIELQGLSVFTPTADNKEFSKRHPKLYNLLCSLDDRLSGQPPFNHWGDFFIITLKFQP